MMRGPTAPELARRMTACSCRHDPARALVPALTAMPGHGIPPGDILADSYCPAARRPDSGRPPATPPRTRPPPTTSRQPSWPGTNPARSPATTATATTG